MTKLAIYVRGSLLTHGYKKREFIWSAEHGIYLYGGALIPAEQFNEVYARAIKTNADMQPMVKVVEVGVAPLMTLADPPLPAPAAAGEITLEAALAVVARDAPHRLKGKTGPKHRVMEVA